MSEVNLKNVLGNVYDSSLFCILKRLWKTNEDLLELSYLEEMKDLNYVFKPKTTIMKMLETHFYTEKKIRKDPHLLQFCYLYSNNENIEEIEISNIMSFYEDVTLICALYYILVTFGFERYEIMYNVVMIISNKYTLNIISQIEYKDVRSMLHDIAFCFPSVIFDLYYHDEKFPLTTTKIFPDFDIPVPIFLPVIVLILPRLHNFPIALLIAINIKIGYILKSVTNWPNLSLNMLYHLISITNSYAVFPEGLRIKICQKYDIIEKHHDRYEFTPCVTYCREKAKKIIATLRINDPTLQYIYSIL